MMNELETLINDINNNYGVDIPKDDARLYEHVFVGLKVAEKLRIMSGCEHDDKCYLAARWLDDDSRQGPIPLGLGMIVKVPGGIKYIDGNFQEIIPVSEVRARLLREIEIGEHSIHRYEPAEETDD